LRTSILSGDYYKTEELTEQVQESLSSSSLRRKLFLDGHDSGSESSTPSSPDRNSHNIPPSSREMMSSVIVSPLQCGIPSGTPLSVCTEYQFLDLPLYILKKNLDQGYLILII